MKIAEKRKVSFEEGSEAHFVHVVVSDVKSRAEEIIKSVQDASWISKLSPLSQLSVKARAEKTIKTLVENIFSKL